MIRRALFVTTILSSIVFACSSTTPPPNPDASTGITCASDFAVAWTDYALCAAGTGGNLGSACPAVSPAATCTDSKPIGACCAWVANPKVALARGPSSLHYNGAPPGQTTVDLSCIATPPTAGASQLVTVTGYLKVFVGGDSDSAGIKVEIYTAGPNGALGTLVGAAATTDTNSPSRINDWLSNCPTDGCVERQYTYANVPTETPLIIHTSDANAADKWYDFYDYNVYFSDTDIVTGDGGGPIVNYDTQAVGTTDPATVTASLGTTVDPSKGLLAGEVHDCGDVRLSGATVNTDYRPEGDIFYFTDSETSPTADKSATTTSTLGLFGGINYTAGVPIHISAVGSTDGTSANLQLIGEFTVQVYPNSVTGLSLRGRRPYQHD
jgi:hypothetical protein